MAIDPKVLRLLLADAGARKNWWNSLQDGYQQKLATAKRYRSISANRMAALVKAEIGAIRATLPEHVAFNTSDSQLQDRARDAVQTRLKKEYRDAVQAAHDTVTEFAAAARELRAAMRVRFIPETDPSRRTLQLLELQEARAQVAGLSISSQINLLKASDPQRDAALIYVLEESLARFIPEHTDERASAQNVVARYNTRELYQTLWHDKEKRAGRRLSTEEQAQVTRDTNELVRALHASREARLGEDVARFAEWDGPALEARFGEVASESAFMTLVTKNAIPEGPAEKPAQPAASAA